MTNRTNDYSEIGLTKSTLQNLDFGRDLGEAKVIVAAIFEIFLETNSKEK